MSLSYNEYRPRLSAASMLMSFWYVFFTNIIKSIRHKFFHKNRRRSFLTLTADLTLEIDLILAWKNWTHFESII